MPEAKAQLADIHNYIAQDISVAIKASKGNRRVVKLLDDVRTIRERMDISQFTFAALF